MKPLTPEKLVQRFKDAILTQVALFNSMAIPTLDPKYKAIREERARLEKEIVQRLSEKD